MATLASHTEVLRCFRLAVAALGAPQAVFINFIRDTREFKACRFLLDCDPTWCQQYLARGLVQEDPWLSYAAQYTEPILASALPHDRQCTAATQWARASGFASAALIPAHAGPGMLRVSLLCLGSRQPGYFETTAWPTLKLAARLLALEMHDWWLARMRDELRERAHLQATDLQLLALQIKGLSTKQMTRATGLGEAAINSRFQRINRRLGVSNRRRAGQLALECALVLP